MEACQCNLAVTGSSLPHDTFQTCYSNPCGIARHLARRLCSAVFQHGVPGIVQQLGWHAEHHAGLHLDARHVGNGSIQHVWNKRHGPFKHAGHGHEHHDGSLLADASADATWKGDAGRHAADDEPMRSDGPRHRHRNTAEPLDCPARRDQLTTNRSAGPNRFRIGGRRVGLSRQS